MKDRTIYISDGVIKIQTTLNTTLNDYQVEKMCMEVYNRVAINVNFNLRDVLEDEANESC